MTPDQQSLLDRIYSQIDRMEELFLSQANQRELSGRDTVDLRTIACGTGTMDDLFAYANRPKREVLQYMLEHHPAYLSRLLANTLSQKDAGS
jgi:hypothetical protein